MNTINEAVDAVAALLGADGKPVTDLREAGVANAYDHEPVNVKKGCSVSASYVGQRSTDYRVAVRLYIADTAPRDAQRLLYRAIEAVDSVLAIGGFSGPSEWEAAFDPTAGVHYAESIQLVPRDTF